MNLDFGQLEASAPEWAAKRPIRIALLGDFGGGAAAGRLEIGSDLASRKPVNVEFDTLDAALGRMASSLQVPLGEQGAPVELMLTELESFHPDTMLGQVELLRELSGLRKRLNNSATFDKAAAEVAKLAGGAVCKPTRVRKSRARGVSPDPSLRLDDFARLTGRSAAGPEAAVANLLRDMVSPFIVPAAKPEKAGLLATVDAAMADALRALLHQSDFQAAESLWRGVDFLLRRLETGPMLQVHLIDVSAEEWAADLSSAPDLADSGLYQLLVVRPGESKDGGYSCIAGLYQMEASPPHAELLGRMARIASAAAAPFITAIDERPWLSRDLHPLIAEAFDELRQLPEADRLMLLGPRFLLRHPYGRRTDPLSSLAFEEFTAQEGLGGLLWGHPAWLALTALYGQKGQPVVADLPFYTYLDADGDSTALPCTERMINTATATRLGASGITALMAHRGEPSVRLAGLNAVSGQALSGGAAPSRHADRGAVKLVAGGVVATVKGASAAKSSAAASRASDDSDSSDSDSSSGGSDDLDALLAGLDDDISSSSDAGDSSDDLDALLASLGSDDSASSSDESSMDSDLDALLKSLG